MFNELMTKKEGMEKVSNNLIEELERQQFTSKQEIVQLRAILIDLKNALLGKQNEIQ